MSNTHTAYIEMNREDREAATEELEEEIGEIDGVEDVEVIKVP